MNPSKLAWEYVYPSYTISDRHTLRLLRQYIANRRMQNIQVYLTLALALALVPVVALDLHLSPTDLVRLAAPKKESSRQPCQRLGSKSVPARS